MTRYLSELAGLVGKRRRGWRGRGLAVRWAVGWGSSECKGRHGPGQPTLEPRGAAGRGPG
jgi:hypothetical protein